MKTLLQKLILFPLALLHGLAYLYCILLNSIKSGLGSYWYDMQAESIQLLKKTVVHNSKNTIVSLSLFTPNWICRYRADSFSSKEPETLSWIDECGGDGVLFDIGANVGLYSLYFAQANKGKVYSFEPSVFNLALLAKNVFENNLQNKINIISNPLTQHNQFATFSHSTTEQGGALSAFGVDYGHDGQEIKKSLTYQTLGFSLDFLLNNKIITDYPTMIKIDVDGIEHLILAGALDTLKHPSCKSVLIEINDSFTAQAESANEILLSCGFNLKEKRQSEIFKLGKFSDTKNQIWIKNY